MPAARILHGDKRYDSNPVRRQIEETGTIDVAPNFYPAVSSFWRLESNAIAAFGREYPFDLDVRRDRMATSPALRAMLDRGYYLIDVWSSEFIAARTTYARNNAIID